LAANIDLPEAGKSYNARAEVVVSARAFYSDDSSSDLTTNFVL